MSCVSASWISSSAATSALLPPRHRTRFQDVRARCEREPELLRNGSGYVLYALMDAVVDRYFPVLDAVEMELENIEDQLFTGSTPRSNIERLYYVKQSSPRSSTRRRLDGVCGQAVRRPRAGRVLGLGEYFRDVYDHLVRLNQSIDSERDTVNTAIQVNVAMITYARPRLRAPRSMGSTDRGTHLYRQPIRHEFQEHARTGLVLRLSAGSRVMAGLDLYFWYRFRKAGWL